MLRMSDLVRGAAAPAEPPGAAPTPGARSIATRAAPAPIATAPRPGTPASIMDALHVSIAGVRELTVAGAAPSWTELETVFRRVVISLEESAELFWLANAPALPSGVDYLVAHQSRVAVLAGRVGLNVGYDRARAVTLATAGAFLDIALWTSLAEWQAPAPVVEAVRQHHGLAGSALGQDAKILGLVDAYAALTLPPSRKPGLRPPEAIREIVRAKNASFSPALIKALLSEISVFPPGTLVRPNTGEVGQVVAVNRNHPLRPRVEVVADSKGNRPNTAKTIDLSETPFLYITGPVSDSTK